MSINSNIDVKKFNFFENNNVKAIRRENKQNKSELKLTLSSNNLIKISKKNLLKTDENKNFKLELKFSELWKSTKKNMETLLNDLLKTQENKNLEKIGESVKPSESVKLSENENFKLQLKPSMSANNLFKSEKKNISLETNDEQKNENLYEIDEKIEYGENKNLPANSFKDSKKDNDSKEYFLLNDALVENEPSNQNKDLNQNQNSIQINQSKDLNQSKLDELNKEIEEKRKKLEEKIKKLESMNKYIKEKEEDFFKERERLNEENEGLKKENAYYEKLIEQETNTLMAVKEINKKTIVSLNENCKKLKEQYATIENQEETIKKLKAEIEEAKKQNK